MKKTVPIIILLLSILTFNAQGQKKDSALFKQIVYHGLNDTKSYLTSPLRWNQKEWLVFSGLCVATGVLIGWGDQAVYDFTNTLHTNNLDAFSGYIEPIGDTYSYLAVGAILLKGLVQKDNYATETAFIAMESYLFGAVGARTAKMLAGRARPNAGGTTNPLQWYGPSIKNPFFNRVSFFSGHTTTTFSIASVFACRYRDTKWVPYVAYGLATLGGLQRIYDNRHWASDVLVGAAVGTATGVFFCKQWEEKTIRFYPVVNARDAGLSMIVPIR